jgi:hypothetical protein
MGHMNTDGGMQMWGFFFKVCALENHYSQWENHRTKTAISIVMSNYRGVKHHETMIAKDPELISSTF